ncbi:hypothetical protein [Phycisphaera mikurensis]|uniref:PEP-CTERM protein-sorting domain-containing protein n=1 Tax=Phycisphaera mikurensis (strain NBRC 102666 / KCTC 22515 / FYK2301M01) TaxID=1142394 RepID=I0IBS6_PHYMF|nr:hypothetical protein [Phycisphaera mikurensis]MBB6442055.1 hypothetical protein [Phycisphaera mikurensis]BAM02714.1 hypothetical protein PSMK_05550 [Phycisphaera mikurensis NBRC 102666]
MTTQRRPLSLILSGLAACLLAGAAGAVPLFVPIPIDAIANGNSPLAGEPEGAVVLGGVPFTLPVRAGNNIWVGGSPAAELRPGLRGVDGVHLLVNVGFGRTNRPGGSVRFLGDGGADATFDLVTGTNVRDWTGSGPAATRASSTNSVEVYAEPGPARIDKLFLALPTAFLHQTLVRIVLTNPSTPRENLVLFNGITAQVLPEPAAAALVLAGVASLAGRRRRLG